MPIIKCDNCNHSMIARKDYYECPICHSIKGNDTIQINEFKYNHKNQLVDYLKKGIDNRIVLSTLVKSVLLDNPKDKTALLLSAYLEKDSKPDLYKQEIDSFFSSVDEKDNYELIFKYLVNYSEYKFLTYLENIIANLNMSEECNNILEIKKKEIEDYIEKTSVINSDVFVCYSSNDLLEVNSIVDSIEKEGFSCWYADRNMPKNHPTNFDYKKNIEMAITNCKVFLVIASKNCMYSNDVQWEIDIASSLDKKRVEYLISSVKHTPKFRDFFDGLQWIDATESDETMVLIERINYLINNKDKTHDTNNHCVKEIDDIHFVTHQNDYTNKYHKESLSINEPQKLETKEKVNIEVSKEPNLKELGIKAYECKDYDEAISRFKLCKQDSEINYYLGRIYLDEYNDKFNIDYGYECFMNSNDIRLYDEINELGKKYYTGNGCQIDLNKAFNCFIKSTELGNDKAMCNVAMCYIRGNGVEKNINLASKYYKMAADKGNVKAMYGYANICLDDDVRDFKDGIEYLTKAANAGLADAQYSLGVCYYKGYGVNLNYNYSLEWINKAITGGSKAAKDYKSLHFNNDIDYDSTNCALELDNIDDLDL